MKASVLEAPVASWDGIGVSVADVVARLAAQRRPPDGGPPLSLAGVLNLIVRVPQPDALEEMRSVVERLAGHQPSRAVLVVESAAGAGIDAQVSTSCRLSGGNAVVGVELVVLSLHGEGRAGDASAIRPLLRSDLPTVLWWPGAPDPSPTGPLARLLPLADRIVTESGREGRGDEAVARLAAWVPGVAGAVTDLAWAAITPWRQLVSQMAAPGDLSPDGEGAMTAEIAHPGACPSAEALLLAGWLRERAGARIRVTMRAGAPGGAPVGGVTIEGPGPGSRIAIAPVEGRQAATVRVAGPGRDEHPRTLPLPGHDRARLLAGELELQRRDLAFERTLPHAAEVASR